MSGITWLISIAKQQSFPTKALPFVRLSVSATFRGDISGIPRTDNEDARRIEEAQVLQQKVRFKKWISAASSLSLSLCFPFTRVVAPFSLLWYVIFSYVSSFSLGGSKMAVKLTKTRLEAINRKRNAVEKYLKKDIVDLLKNGLDYNAYGRVSSLFLYMPPGWSLWLIAWNSYCIIWVHLNFSSQAFPLSWISGSFSWSTFFICSKSNSITLALDHELLQAWHDTLFLILKIISFYKNWIIPINYFKGFSFVILVFFFVFPFPFSFLFLFRFFALQWVEIWYVNEGLHPLEESFEY